MSSPSVLTFKPRHDKRKRQQAMGYFYEAYRAQQRKDYALAIEKYRQSIEICPTAEAHTFLGWAYSYIGELDLAIEECQRAIEMDPDFGNPYNDIGAYLIASGRHEEAIPYLGQALQAKRYRAYHYAHFNLGRAKEYQGDFLNAYRHYRAALNLEPRYWMAQHAIKHLCKCLMK